MLRRWIGPVVAAAVLLASPARAFDKTDVGAYQAIDEDGELTAKVFRFVKKKEGWRIEDHQDNGTWLDVTCQGGCPLKEASVAEVEEYFQAHTPSNVTNRCLRNEAFAFCRIERTTQGHVEVGHALVVIVEGQAHPIRLRALGKPPGADAAPGPAPGPGPRSKKKGGDAPDDDGADAPAKPENV